MQGSEMPLNRTPLSPEDEALMAMDPIASAFPLRFAGGVTYTHITGQCRACGGDISPENFRGQVASPVSRMVSVDARGYCESCRLVSRFQYRFYADGRFTGIQNGKWTTWRLRKPPSALRRLLRLLFW